MIYILRRQNIDLVLKAGLKDCLSSGIYIKRLSREAQMLFYGCRSQAHDCGNICSCLSIAHPFQDFPLSLGKGPSRICMG